MELITRKEIVREKTPSAHMRVYSKGMMTISYGMAQRMGLEEEDRLSFFQDDKTYYVAKSNREESYTIRKGMCIHSKDMATRLIEVFGTEEEDRSLKLGIPPEHETHREQHGTKLFRLHKR